MKYLQRILVVLPFLFMALRGLTQEDSTRQNQKAVFKIGVFYNSHLNYYGRTDSLRSSGVFPVFELWADQHFYISAAPVFIYNSATTIAYAGTVTSAGYMFRNKKWAGNTYAVVPIYKENSTLVQSALKFQLSSNFSKLTKVINLTLGGDIKYSDQLDYGMTAGIDHLFRVESKNGLVFVTDPSAYLFAGTQQFTKTSYKQGGFLIFPGAQQSVTSQVDEFNVMSYEFSIPTVLAKGKWQVIVNPAYVIPQHLVIVPNRPDLSERGRDMFYLTAGVKVSL